LADVLRSVVGEVAVSSILAETLEIIVAWLRFAPALAATFLELFEEYLGTR
jgi:hypothetical protein